MKITSTDMALYAEHTTLLRQESRETLRAWRGERPDFEQANSPRRPLASAIADISATGQRLLAAPAVPPASTFSETAAIEAAREAIDNDPFLSLVRRMIEALTGEEVRVFDMQSFSAALRHTEVRAESVSAATQGASSGRAGYGLEYDYHAVREEAEATSFSAEGIVHTADGQELSFKLDLEMTRYYREETRVSQRAGDAVRKDPLVVNFDGTATQLRDRTAQFFRFDLDGDGKEENLPLFASGSGFLVFDRNGDGRVESSELFGPATDSGFEELALLDSDANDWIDESDPVFSKLSVWTPAAEGTGALHSLTDLGIGALALAHVASPFALRGSDNSDLGLIRSSGVFLHENGSAGSLQEIDLTV